MDIFAAINQRRSVRRFLPQPIARRDLEKIVAAGIEAPSGCNMQLRQYVIVDDPQVLAKLRPMSKALANAPACIVILVEPKASPYGEYWRQDASAAMENMLLAAVGLGLGGCWIEGALVQHESEIAAILNVPAPLRVACIMSLGKPAEPGQRPVKSEPAEVTHYNGFGSRR